MDGDGARRQIHIRMDADLYERLARYAGEEGLTMTRAAVTAMERGLSEQMTASELASEARERDERVAEALEALERAVSGAVGEMAVARKNIGKAAKASYGGLSLLSWLYVDFMRFLDAANFDSGRVRAWSRDVSPADAFKLFESSGGALQADPATDYYRSLELARRRAPFASMATEDLFGADPSEWSAMCGADDDASAIRIARGAGGRRGEGARR